MLKKAEKWGKNFTRELKSIYIYLKAQMEFQNRKTHSLKLRIHQMDLIAEERIGEVEDRSI